MTWFKITSWIGAAFSMTAYFYNIAKDPICFLLYEGSAIIFIYLNIKIKDYGQSALWVFYFFANIYGYLVWTNIL